MVTIPIGIVIATAISLAISILSSIKLWQLFGKQKEIYEQLVHDFALNLAKCETERDQHAGDLERFREGSAKRLYENLPCMLSAENWEHLRQIFAAVQDRYCEEFATWCTRQKIAADERSKAESWREKLPFQWQLLYAELGLVFYYDANPLPSNVLDYLIDRLESRQMDTAEEAAFQALRGVRVYLGHLVERRYQIRQLEQQLQEEYEAAREAIGELLQPPVGEGVTPNGLVKEEIMSTTIYDPWQEPEQHPYKKRITNGQGREIVGRLIKAIPNSVLNPGQKSQLVEAYLTGGMTEVYSAAIEFWGGDETNAGFIRFAHVWLATLIPISWRDNIFRSQDSIFRMGHAIQFNWKEWETWGMGV